MALSRIEKIAEEQRIGGYHCDYISDSDGEREKDLPFIKEKDEVVGYHYQLIPLGGGLSQKGFVVKKIIAERRKIKRNGKRRRGSISANMIEYLTRFENYPPANDEWLPPEQVGCKKHTVAFHKMLHEKKERDKLLLKERTSVSQTPEHGVLTRSRPRTSGTFRQTHTEDKLLLKGRKSVSQALGRGVLTRSRSRTSGTFGQTDTETSGSVASKVVQRDAPTNEESNHDGLVGDVEQPLLGINRSASAFDDEFGDSVPCVLHNTQDVLESTLFEASSPSPLGTPEPLEPIDFEDGEETPQMIFPEEEIIDLTQTHNTDALDERRVMSSDELKDRAERGANFLEILKMNDHEELEHLDGRSGLDKNWKIGDIIQFMRYGHEGGPLYALVRFCEEPSNLTFEIYRADFLKTLPSEKKKGIEHSLDFVPDPVNEENFTDSVRE